MNFGAPELLIVLAVIVLLFGARRLPSLARSLGEAQRELKKASVGEPSDIP
jgi:sec-independent protein translocase protein TatA